MWFFAVWSYLVKDVNFVVSQVQVDQAAEASEGALFYLEDVAALQVEVGQVRRVHKCPTDYHLQVIIPQVEFHCNLGG